DWPRGNLAGDLAGLVDIGATPEDDSLSWEGQTSHEGLNPAFDYDRRRFSDSARFGTHVSTNEVVW
ncbi:MAG: hypothetical protein AAF658_16850, partial [Myxococcota bacterium]